MAEDSEWVPESVAGFLGSPDWLIPLADFMENHCSGVCVCVCVCVCVFVHG